MNDMHRRAIGGALALVAFLALPACKKGSLERAGAKADKAIEDAKKAGAEAADKAKEDAAKMTATASAAVDKAAEQAAEKVRTAGSEAAKATSTAVAPKK